VHIPRVKRAKPKNIVILSTNNAIDNIHKAQG